MATTGEKSVIELYLCTKCRRILILDDKTDVLPPCPKCQNTNFIKL